MNRKDQMEKKILLFSGKNIFGLVTLASHWPRCLVVKKVVGEHCNNTPNRNYSVILAILPNMEDILSKI
jgi:hypothetical protein